MAIRIDVNGKECKDIASLPAEVREAVDRSLGAAFADRDGNGVPDILDQDSGATFVTQRYVLDGKVYDDVSQLPHEVRSALEKATPGMRTVVTESGAGAAPVVPETMSWRARVAVAALIVLALGALVAFGLGS